MPEHAIRLRGAWQYRFLTDPEAPPQRVDLPTHWANEIAGPLLLTRRFQGPAIDTTNERISLRFARVSGLRSIQLNDQDITPSRLPSASEAFDLPVDLTPNSSHVLALVVDRQDHRAPQGSSPETESDPEAWGIIALLIQPRRDGRPEF